MARIGRGKATVKPMFSTPTVTPTPVIIQQPTRETPAAPGPATRFKSAMLASVAVGLLMAFVLATFANFQWHAGRSVGMWAGWGFGAGFAATLAIWTVATLVDWHSAIWQVLYIAERATGRDLDGDQQVGRPEPEAEPPARVVVELRDTNTHGRPRTRWLEFGVPIDKLATFARSVLAGQSLSEARWTGGGGLFSRSEFARMRQQMIDAGILQWVNPDAPAQGLAVTRAGRCVLRQLADNPTPPAELAGE